MQREEIVSLIRKSDEALDALQRYLENPKNPDSGPEFSKLVEDMFATEDALRDALKKTKR